MLSIFLTILRFTTEVHSFSISCWSSSSREVSESDVIHEERRKVRLVKLKQNEINFHINSWTKYK